MSMKARLLLLLLCCFMAHPVRVLSQVQVVAGVASQSPDARLIEVNGGFSTTVGNNFALAIKWGDGAETQGLFPARHYYSSPGEYLVTVTAFNDRGNSASVSFRHVVPTLTSDIATVQLAQNFLGMKTGETVRIGLAAFNQQGQKLSLQNRTISFYHANADVPSDFSVQFSDTALVVRAGAIRNQDAWTGAVFVYVDKKSSATPLHIVVSKHAGAFRAIAGERTVSYLPTAFFTRSAVADSEYNKVLDLAFEAERNTLHGLYSELRAQAISYAPPVFGSSGNPLLLGDFALPQNGIPFFDVLIHEMGHNMHFQLPFFNLVGVPGAFYMETLAEWYVQYALNRIIITEHGARLAPSTLAALQEVLRRNREMHLNELRNYIQNGKKFNYEETVGGSHPLVQKIFEYSDQKGWDRIGAFMAHWDMKNFPAYIKIFLKHGGIQPVNNRVTIMLALLSAVFDNDVRPDFRALSFPINEPFFDEFYAALRAASSVAQTPRPKPPRDFVLREGRPNPFQASTTLTFELSRSGLAALEIYNLAAQKVGGVFFGELPMGVHHYQWNAESLPSGVYFYRLQFEGQVHTKKLMLLRE